MGEDRVTAAELEALRVGGVLGRAVEWAEALPSTNDRAKALAEAGAAHGTVVVADQQTAGRGRRGRAWVSPPGLNLYLSVVLRPNLPPARAPELTLVTAVALCDAIRQWGVDAAIKWPNDLLASGRKIAGILTELEADAVQVHSTVVGIGVNVNARAEDFPDALRGAATSLLVERGAPVPRADFAAACLSALEAWLDRHAREGFAPVREAWRARSLTLGQDVRVRLEARELTGRAEDIDASGALLVRTEAGVERVLVGDVETVRPRGG